jgi:hypothetical protein
MLVRRAAFERIGVFDENLHCGDFVDWFVRARELGLCMDMLTDVVTLRRLHTNNMGILRYHQQQLENITVLKRMLDRRRAGVRPVTADPMEKV